METKFGALIDNNGRFIGISHHKKASRVTIKDRDDNVPKLE